MGVSSESGRVCTKGQVVLYLFNLYSGIDILEMEFSFYSIYMKYSRQ